MPPTHLRSRRHAAFAALLLSSPFAGCGSDPAAPQPFADVAGTYVLQSVNGSALPWNIADNGWLFERRLVLHADGRLQKFDVFCAASADACPRMENATSKTMQRASDGTIVVQMSGTVRWTSGAPDSPGGLVFLETVSSGVAAPPITFRFTRR